MQSIIHWLVPKELPDWYQVTSLSDPASHNNDWPPKIQTGATLWRHPEQLSSFKITDTNCCLQWLQKCFHPHPERVCALVYLPRKRAVGNGVKATVAESAKRGHERQSVYKLQFKNHRLKAEAARERESFASTLWGQGGSPTFPFIMS